VADDLGYADYREMGSIHQSFASGGPHPLSADAEKFQTGVMAAEGIDELRPVHVSGSFSGGDENSHFFIVTTPHN
jgi:hypothetical protein